MAYTSKNGRRPMEMASKTNHSAIIRHPMVQDFINSCSIPQPSDPELVKLNAIPIDEPLDNKVRIIITIDGGYSEVEVKKEYPSSSYTFFQFGGLLFETDDLKALHDQPFIDPEDMAKLRNIQRFPFVLPTKNIRLNKCTTLTESVRWTLFDFFTKAHDGEKPFIQALRWLLFEEYNPKTSNASWTLASCPVCRHAEIIIVPTFNNITICPHCEQAIYLTDVFRLHEAIDDELGAGGILGYLGSVLEQMLLVHLIKTVWDLKKNMLPEILFIKDGPLAFFGQTANMHEPMRRLLNHIISLSKQNSQGTRSGINLVGVEKSGPFVEHAIAISDSIEPGHALILGSNYIYKYITPGAGKSDEPFASTSYYSSKVIYKANDGNIYVLTLPTQKALAEPNASDLTNLNLVLYHVAKLKCHMYDNALVPIALVNKLVSLSDHPSSKILGAFVKGNKVII